MLDWIDIHIEVPRVDYEKLSDDRLGEKSTVVQFESRSFVSASAEAPFGRDEACFAPIYHLQCQDATGRNLKILPAW